MISIKKKSFFGRLTEKIEDVLLLRPKPDESMLEVAITSFNIALDPQRYMKEKKMQTAKIADEQADTDVSVKEI